MLSKVVVDMSMSLDGFVAGPDVSVEHPMGVGGMRLHEWLFRDTATDADRIVSGEMPETTGAVVLGRRTFDVGIGEWGDTPFPVPCFVVTHRGRDDVAQKSGTFTFITGGIESALQRAREAAGEKDVRLMGAGITRQSLAAGLVDELQLNVVPVLLGEGARLFDRPGGDHIELEQTRVLESSGVTHIKYRVVKENGRQ
jgi:dihydrofolate reductase